MSIHDPSSAHAPPSTSTSSDRAPSTTVTVQSEVRRLSLKRSQIDAQLGAYFDVLKSNNIDMHAPLVDKEGFPRSDIDVAGVRTARVHIIRLRNDLGDLQREMEQVVLRGLPRDDGEPAVAAEAEDAQMQDQGAEGETPFAKVDAVAPGSPADTAGMKRDDLLVSLGGVSAAAAGPTDALRAVAALVGRSEGVQLAVVVTRGAERKELMLTPRSGWGGRGLLGCHIVPHAS